MSFAKFALALGTTVGARQLLHAAQNLGPNDILGSVGLERRRSAMDKLLPALGWVGVGTVIGAGVALLLAPSTGKELRQKVSQQIGEAKTRLDNGIHTLEETLPGHNGGERRV